MLVLVANAPDIAPEAYRHWAALLIQFSLVGVVLVGAVALLFVIRRRRRAKRRRGMPTDRDPSAWAEAGRRAEPIEPDPDLPEDNFGDQSEPGPPGDELF